MLLGNSLVIPTVLYVGPGGRTAIDGPATPDDGWRKLERFKLFLLHDQDFPPHARRSGIVQETAKEMQAADMGAVSLTAAYLKHLWAKASVSLADRLRPERLQDLYMRLVVTIPAVWPQDASGRMHKALEDSGILGSARLVNLHFMRETEASAVYSLTDIALDSALASAPAVRAQYPNSSRPPPASK